MNNCGPPERVASTNQFGLTAVENEMREMNLNDTVLVKLTDHGRQLMRQNHDTFWAGRVPPYEFNLPQEDEDGWSRWQLWSLMQEFGPHIHHGMRNPCGLTIRIEGPDDRNTDAPQVDPMAAVRAICK